jgi:hypothetical protein
MKHCDGCLGGCKKGDKYYNHIERRDIYCPCGTCLVKVVCGITCDIYTQFYSERLTYEDHIKKE